MESTQAASAQQAKASWMSRLRTTVIRLGRPVHRRLREEKVELFLSLTARAKRESLLDVGGGSGIDSEFLPLYRAFREVTVVNLDPSPYDNRLSHLRQMVADGRRLPFADRSFDWVFSNAVLEHVGAIAKQRELAAEVRRVARCGYFVTTPNKLFPIEPHTLLPFYQFLPESWQRRAVRISPYYLREYEEIHLLYARQLQNLFPEARVVSTGFPVIGTSLVAMYAE